jgi:hypothetical protein
MPIAGLVLTLTAQSADERLQLMAAVAETPGVTLGEPHGPRVPLVLEAASHQALDQAWLALDALPGVQLVELAFADFSDLEPFTDDAPPRRNRPRAGGNHGSA